jgi:hypothetical protein
MEGWRSRSLGTAKSAQDGERERLPSREGTDFEAFSGEIRGVFTHSASTSNLCAHSLGKGTHPEASKAVLTHPFSTSAPLKRGLSACISKSNILFTFIFFTSPLFHFFTSSLLHFSTSSLQQVSHPKLHLHIQHILRIKRIKRNIQVAVVVAAVVEVVVEGDG